MNNLGISDAYDLSQKLTAENNSYGFTTNVDSHLTKNSEWGAIAYLTHVLNSSYLAMERKLRKTVITNKKE